MSTLQVPFGQRPDGRLVEVSQVERGLACDCCCPACGEQLLAKKGTVNVQHFSHRSGSDCATGAETALHLAAKQLIADKRWVQLPELSVQVTRNDPRCGLFAPKKVYGRGEAWHFDRVVLEQMVGDVVPDAVGYVGEVGHGVEIRVTHAVDENKQAYLAGLRLPSIEIDLSAWVGKLFTFDALDSVVITSVENKRWLFHPQQAAWEALLLAGFDDWRQARLAEMARMDERQVQRQVAPPPSREDVYRAANQKYRALPNAEKWRRLELELGLPRNQFPTHLRVTLREGADAVQAEKDLWQGALFAKFILGEDKLDKKVPNEWALSVWLAQRFGVNGGDDAARPAVRSYLNYLKACRFLRWQAGDLYVAHSQVTVPVKERPSAPLRQGAPAAAAAPSIQWLNTWPDDERLRRWAAEECKNGDGFDADWFVGWLLRRREPPNLDEVQDAFAEADGNPATVMTVLRGLGVVANTWRYFSAGEAAPWVPP